MAFPSPRTVQLPLSAEMNTLSPFPTCRPPSSSSPSITSRCRKESSPAYSSACPEQANRSAVK